MTPKFSEALREHNKVLRRKAPSMLQVNIGYVCNLACRHCHLECGPSRTELMNRETAEQVIDLARRNRFPVIDITGGAPELNPLLPELLETLAPLTEQLILRTNLVLLKDERYEHIIELCRTNRVAIFASIPSVNRAQAEAQRGDGVFPDLIEVLQKLNKVGYGRPDSGLELNLVSNPSGAFLPAAQQIAEEIFRRALERKYDIEFSNLFLFANVPLGRFKSWLISSNNYDSYLEKLGKSFNPCAVENLMCRYLISVAPDGYLYDCDFHQATGLGLGGRQVHISELGELPGEGDAIAVADYCYSCTAGSGFT
jgi:radical SAM/Cys-rich protein